MSICQASTDRSRQFAIVTHSGGAIADNINFLLWQLVTRPVNSESGRAITRLKQFPEIPRDVRQMDWSHK